MSIITKNIKEENIKEKNVNYFKNFNKSTLNTPDKYGNTALMYAVVYDKYEICKLFIEKGANLDLQDSDKRTALMYAIYWHCFTIHLQ